MTPSNGDHSGPAPDANASSYPEYKLGHTAKEVERMRNQHEWIKGSFGGLIKAPIDYFKQGQKILDSATADGELARMIFLFSLSISLILFCS